MVKWKYAPDSLLPDKIRQQTARFLLKNTITQPDSCTIITCLKKSAKITKKKTIVARATIVFLYPFAQTNNSKIAYSAAALMT
ncbi:hypothetical protein [Selenomonas ruminantium]|uniref:hypothetical protein n=1 Tax=Selenomonas ruminantium TaxID=971 RepID=UPI0015BD4865|nr:hypothetical protein [Selenomonas ruminantium]